MRARIDTSAKEIVKGLRDREIEVYDIRHPVDKLLRFWCGRHQEYCWMPIEIKTAYGKKIPKPRVDPRQDEQNRFLTATRTPVVTNLEAALAAINLRHRIVLPLRYTQPQVPEITA